MEGKPPVLLFPGSEANPLAEMVYDLVTQNLDQNPHKITELTNLRGSIILEVTDAESTLTMSFQDGKLIIHGNGRPPARLHIKTESGVVMLLANMSIRKGMPYPFDDTGKEVGHAFLTGRLKVRGLLFHLPTLVKFARLMSVNP